MASGLAQVEFTLVYDDVSRRPEHFVLKEGDRVRLGRNPKLEVCFDVLRVSWIHCEFIVLRSSDGDAQLGIKDLSSNGTGLRLPGESRLRRMEKDEESPVADGLRVVIPVKSQGKKNSAEEIAKEAFVVRLGNHTNGTTRSAEMEALAAQAAAAQSGEPSTAARHNELDGKLAMAPPPLPAFLRAAAPAVHHTSAGGTAEVEQPAVPAANKDEAGEKDVEPIEAEEEEEEEEEEDSFQVKPPKRRRLEEGTTQEVSVEKGTDPIAAMEEEDEEEEKKEKKADEEGEEESKEEKEEKEKEEEKDNEEEEEEKEDEEDDKDEAEVPTRAAAAAEKVATKNVATDKAALFQAAAEEAARAADERAAAQKAVAERAAAEKAAAEKAAMEQARREARAAELAKRKAEEATEIQKAAFEKAMSEFRSKRKQPLAKGDQAEGDEAEDVGRRAHEDLDEVMKARIASGADGPANGGQRILGRDVVLPVLIQQKFQSGEALILKGGVAETSGRFQEAYEHYRLGLAVLVKEVFPSLRRTPQAASELQKQVLDYLNRAEKLKASIRIQRELD